MARRQAQKTEAEKNRQKLMKALTFLGSVDIRVGLAPEEGNEPKKELRNHGKIETVNLDKNVATAAYENEFGTINGEGFHVPARPAFRGASRGWRTKRAIVEFEKELSAKFQTGSIGDAELVRHVSDLGLDLAKILVDELDSAIPPPNAARTIRNKGFDKALEATKQTMNSISAQIFARKQRKWRIFANGSKK